MALTEKQRELFEDIRGLQLGLREDTYNKFKRINPFFEDLCDWKERGFFWTKQENVTIYNSVTIVGDTKIGENTWIGSFVNLDGTGGLEIGSNCSISSGCQILSHDTISWAISGGRQEYSYEKTTIGDRCFVGTLSVITKGVQLGSECVVGAGAVVTKSFPNNSIVAGVPAKLIGRTIVDSRNGKVKFKYFKNRY